MPIGSLAVIRGPALTMPPAPAYGAHDWLAAIAALLPRGRAWPRDPNSALMRFWAGVAQAQARVTARQANLLADAYPAATAELLPEWEASVGLPDPCFGPLATVTQRRALMLYRLQARAKKRGTLNPSVLTEAAAALGITVAVSEYRNRVIGLFRCGDRLYARGIARKISLLRVGFHVGDRLVDRSTMIPASDWNFAVLVTATGGVTSVLRAGDRVGTRLADWASAPIAPLTVMRAGAHVGDRLASWGNQALECTLRRLAPPHLKIRFAYSS